MKSSTTLAQTQSETEVKEQVSSEQEQQSQEQHREQQSSSNYLQDVKNLQTEIEEGLENSENIQD